MAEQNNTLQVVDNSPDEVEPEEGVTQETEQTEKTPEPKKPTNEVKLLIHIKDDSILLGIQSPDCDPVFKTLKGTMAVALKQVPALAKEAKEKWAAAPRYPKANLPEPPPRPTSVHAPAASKPEPKPQMNLF